MAVENIQVPDLGDSETVEVIEILIAVGDEINENDSLLVLETDKAAMEIPAPKAGVVTKILVKVGDQVSQGDEIVTLELETGDEKPAVAPSPSKAEAPVEVVKDVVEEEDQAPVVAEEASSESVEIKIPDLGEDGDVEVIDILVAVGDDIQEEDGLVTLETDKAAMDVPSPSSGKVEAINLKVGDKVSQGALILTLLTAGQGASVEAAPSPSVASSDTAEVKISADPAPAKESTPTSASTVSVVNNENVHAGPAVRKLARQLGVDLSLVPGSATKGRIVKEDVHEFVKTSLQNGGGSTAPSAGLALPTMKDIDFSKFGEIEEVAMSKLHQVTAQNMTNNWLTVPHVTQFEEVDVTDLEDFRSAQKQLAEKKGVKLTPVPFIIKACAQALAEYPQFNVSLHSSGTKLIQKNYINIGVAVATPAGLMVPVIKNVDQKSIWQISAELAELGAKAKDRKLTKEDMEGGCFTISSLGGLGGKGFTPIVNAPEVAILGVSKTSIQPVYVNGEFVPRKMMPFSLSYDHRAVNGLDGGLFCTYLNSLLSDIRLMVL